MPKMRGIKPETWTDDKLVEVSIPARLLFIGMWNYACDNGHVEDKPRQIKMRIMPADDVDVTALIDELIEVGCVVREETHLTVPNLPQHQRIDRRYFTTCDHCAPDEIPANSRSPHVVHTTGTQRDPNGDTTGTRRGHALKEGEGRKEGEGDIPSNEHPAGRSKKKPATRLSENWEPTDEHRSRAVQDGIDLAAQVGRFKAHAEANDRRQVNWNAAFTQWLLNVPEWQRGVKTGRPGPAFPHDGTEAEKDAWVKAQPLPTDGAYYGGSKR